MIERLEKYKTAPDWILKARVTHKDLKALVYGDDFRNLILQIEHIESDKLATTRRKYSRPICDLNEKLLAPTHNVYSATGFDKSFSNITPQQQSELLKTLSNVRGGKSMQEWLETFWIRDLQVVDPSGLLFFEASKEQKKCYPTYKSIDVVRYYEAEGMKVNFVIFEPVTFRTADGQTIQKIRYVDEKIDAMYRVDGSTFTLIEEETIPNPFRVCPALVNSDLQRLGSEERLSPLLNVIEAQKEYLADRSVNTIYKRRNGFPIPFRPHILCPTCQGQKVIGIEKCTSCEGTGFLQTKDVGLEIILPISLDADKPVQLPKDFAGFIKPDLEFLKYHIEDKAQAERDMYETLWGTKEKETRDQTAMATMLNLQPMTSKLNKWSATAETIDELATEIVANYVLLTKKPETKIASFRYGRNYIIFSPMQLLDNYQQSKKSGDPDTVKDAKLIEFLNAKYQNDPFGLQIALKKKELEIFVHYTVEQVASIFGNETAQKKMLFVDWWETLTEDDKLKPIKALEEMRDNYINLKIVKNDFSSEEVQVGVERG